MLLDVSIRALNYDNHKIGTIACRENSPKNRLDKNEIFQIIYTKKQSRQVPISWPHYKSMNMLAGKMLLYFGGTNQLLSSHNRYESFPTQTDVKSTYSHENNCLLGIRLTKPPCSISLILRDKT